MQDYLVTYKGRKIELRGKPGYFNRKDFDIIEGDFHAVALKNMLIGSWSLILIDINKYWSVKKWILSAIR